MIWTYGWSEFRRDLIAGLTVSAIAVPQAMAYALIAGIDPLRALFGDRRDGGGLDLRFLLAFDQWADERHFSRCLHAQLRSSIQTPEGLPLRRLFFLPSWWVWFKLRSRCSNWAI